MILKLLQGEVFFFFPQISLLLSLYDILFSKYGLGTSFSVSLWDFFHILSPGLQFMLQTQ